MSKNQELNPRDWEDELRHCVNLASSLAHVLCEHPENLLYCFWSVADALEGKLIEIERQIDAERQKPTV